MAEWPANYLLITLGIGIAVLALGFACGRWRHSRRETELSSKFENDAAILKLVVEHAHEGLVLQDIYGRIEWSNPAYTRLTGYTAEEIRGRRPQEFVLTPENELPAEAIENFEFDLNDIYSGFKELILNRRKNGEQFWNQLTFAVVEGDTPETTRMITLCQDVTSQVEHVKALEEARNRLKHQAEHDDLTGVANRTGLAAYLQERLAHPEGGNGKIGVVHIDLDHFKDINDSHGHVAGDAVLRHAAKVLENSLEGRGLVARIGGDEFIGIVAEPQDQNHMEMLGRKILDGLANPVMFDRQPLRAAGSVGLVLADTAKTSASELIHRADIALYAAKRSGRNRLSWYTDALGAAHRRKRMILAKLDRDLEKGDLTLLMEPQFDIEQQQIVGFEVSTRWMHPSDGSVDPIQMLSQQDDSKRIAKVERFALRNGLSQVKRLREASNIPFKMCVNLTEASFKCSRFQDKLLQWAREMHIEPEDLVIELDEKIIRFDEPDGLLGQVEKLSANGVQVGLDEFGGGHGGAGQLLHMKADVMKVSKGLIAGLEHETNKRQLVQSVIKLAAQFGLKVVAVGVDHPEQLEILKDFGCTLIQGKLISRPLSPDEAEMHMREFTLPDAAQ
ncbi:putative bifunctional diguanylate cyclase/phosphodiesterase [Roseibium sp. SCP14]|uniref:putative bifunctional diguanylate cyclase/phosphodiesterase n=1 Tax=Roseibium sp. SCP14 TaxID=3141375 RepID=UPI0033350734